MKGSDRKLLQEICAVFHDISRNPTTRGEFVNLISTSARPHEPITGTSLTPDHAVTSSASSSWVICTLIDHDDKIFEAKTKRGQGLRITGAPIPELNGVWKAREGGGYVHEEHLDLQLLYDTPPMHSW